MKFGIGLPNCREGTDYPAGFIQPSQLVEVAQAAERLGFYSVWVDDHLSINRSLVKVDQRPPSYYEAFMSLSYLASVTSKVKLGFAVLVTIFRDPILVAMQTSTLDAFSNGRVLLGLGLGTRDEFQTVNPRASKSHRGNMLDEQIEVMKALFSQTVASYKGQYYEFDEVVLYPKPVQNPLPIYITGKASESTERMARSGNGCFLPPNENEFKERRQELCDLLEKAGRNISDVDIAISSSLCIAPTHEKAIERLRRSRVASRFKDKGLDGFLSQSVVGSPSEIIEKIGRFKEAGLNHCTFQRFAASSVGEFIEQMEMLSQDVMPAFKS